MRRTLCRILLLTLMAVSIAVLIRYNKGHDFLAVSCVDNIPAAEIALRITLENELEMEGMDMRLVYQMARRNIVKVTVKSSAGSGIIWKIDNDIVIVSNKHLLMKDVRAKVTFCNGDAVTADVIGYSQQYDVGFLKVDESSVNDRLLRDIYDCFPVLLASENQDDRDAFTQSYKDTRIMQVGVANDSTVVDYYEGTVREMSFQPLFNTSIIVTDCYSRAGMSGGGLFDSNGRLLGMVSGGEVPDKANKKESTVTYSIPAGIIKSEYELILAER